MYRNVRAEMARKGYTLEYVSGKMGINLATLSQKLNGRYPITLDEARKIREILNVDMTIDELFEVTN